MFALSASALVVKFSFVEGGQPRYYHKITMLEIDL